MAVELYVHGDIVSWELPRVEVQPIIGYFNLIAVDDFLLKDTISITQAISPSRVVQGSHAIKETSSQAAETAITESRVVFLGYDILDSETQILETGYRSRSDTILINGRRYPYLVPRPSYQR